TWTSTPSLHDALPICFDGFGKAEGIEHPEGIEPEDDDVQREAGGDGFCLGRAIGEGTTEVDPDDAPASDGHLDGADACALEPCRSEEHTSELQSRENL